MKAKEWRGILDFLVIYHSLAYAASPTAVRELGGPPASGARGSLGRPGSKGANVANTSSGYGSGEAPSTPRLP
jgi:hypothetical protein